MISSPTSGSDPQHARTKGLARLSAVTLGAGAAGVVGAFAIALTLPSPTAATSASSASVSPSAPTSTNDDNSKSEESDDSGANVTTPQLQPAAPPSGSSIPPVATSGAS